MCVPSTYIYSIHTECDDLRPSAVEDCHDRSSKSNAAGQSTTGACVTLEGAARPDLGCSSSCKRERRRRPLNPATCLHNLTILTILKENTHNTHMLTIAQKLILTSSSSYYSLRGPVSSIWPPGSTGSSAAHRSYSSFCLASSSPYQEFHNSPSSSVSWGAGPILFILATALP